MGSISDETILRICGELSELLGTEANDDIARYLLSMESIRDLEEYLRELLDMSMPLSRKFVENLLDVWRQLHDKNYSKTPKSTNTASKNSKKKSDEAKSYKSENVNNQNAEKENDQISPASMGGKGKKKNFSPLFGVDGRERTVAKLPGRHACECQAHKHPLVNNCLNCGRVVCDQEGSGPCLFCGKLVCTKEEQEIISRNSKKSQRLHDQLMMKGSEGDRSNDGLEKALQHRNKLLEYDRTSVKRTQVIDDESDYFSADLNRWLNQKEKEALKKREDELRSIRFASRKDRKITLDFAGRRVIEEDPNIDVYNADDEVVQSVNFSVDTSHEKVDPGNFSVINPDSSMQPEFIPNAISTRNNRFVSGKSTHKQNKVVRVQDAELQQMSDEGVAMSMHQPWASLLVAGIKKHEGRSWYTAHRGVLWIAATAQKPTEEDIALVENQYRLLYNDPHISFPKHYPVSCVLGRVEVTDCIAQDDYREKFPGGESESPFVFICDNPKELAIKFPIKGKHKIYKLDSAMHKSIRNAVMSSN